MLRQLPLRGPVSSVISQIEEVCAKIHVNGWFEDDSTHILSPAACPACNRTSNSYLTRHCFTIVDSATLRAKLLSVTDISRRLMVNVLSISRV